MEIKYQKYQRNIEGIAVLECENGNIFQARSHNLFIDILNG